MLICWVTRSFYDARLSWCTIKRLSGQRSVCHQDKIRLKDVLLSDDHMDMANCFAASKCEYGKHVRVAVNANQSVTSNANCVRCNTKPVGSPHVNSPGSLGLGIASHSEPRWLAHYVTQMDSCSDSFSERSQVFVYRGANLYALRQALVQQNCGSYVSYVVLGVNLEQARPTKLLPTFYDTLRVAQRAERDFAKTTTTARKKLTKNMKHTWSTLVLSLRESQLVKGFPEANTNSHTPHSSRS